MSWLIALATAKADCMMLADETPCLIHTSCSTCPQDIALLAWNSLSSWARQAHLYGMVTEYHRVADKVLHDCIADLHHPVSHQELAGLEGMM